MYKFNSKNALRWELQSLTTKQDQKDWAEKALLAFRVRIDGAETGLDLVKKVNDILSNSPFKVPEVNLLTLRFFPELFNMRKQVISRLAQLKPSGAGQENDEFRQVSTTILFPREGLN